MGRKGIEVQVEPVTGKERDATRSQALSQSVDELMSHVLCAGSELKHGQNLGARINGQPQPEHLGTSAEPCAQFIQLHVRELEVAEIVLV